MFLRMNLGCYYNYHNYSIDYVSRVLFVCSAMCGGGFSG